MTSNSVDKNHSEHGSEQKQSIEAFQEFASDCELLAIFVQTRSRDVAEQIVRRHGPMVSGVIRRMLSQSNDAEDAFQATFLILFQSAHRIQKQASLSAWLYGVAYRTAYRVRQRAKQRSMTPIDETSFDPHENIDPLEKIVRESQLEQLDRELNHLHENLKEIIVEHHLLGFTAPQIAERLNLSVSAVEGRLRRARSQLRERLSRRGISFSVALALAAAYQNQTVAAASQLWTSRFIESDFFSQSLASKPLPSSNPSLHPLIQGELAMKSLVVKSGGAAACLVAAICAIPYMASSSGQAVSPSVVMASAGETETTTHQSASFESSSPLGSIVSRIANNPPDNSILAQLADNNQQNPLSTNNPSGVTLIGTDGTTSAAEQGTLKFGGGQLQLREQPSKVIPFVKPSGPLPNWMIDGGTLAQEENAARERIRELMRNKVTLEFNGTPLRHVMDSFATSAKVPIFIDTASLEASGVAALEDPVSLRGMGEVSLQRALKLVLDPMQLQYVVEPEHILITTKDNGAVRHVRTYDLAYLVPSSDWSESIIALIQSMVPGNWDVYGGEDTIHPFGSMLVVSCPEEAHLGIEGLLFELSKMNKDNLGR